MSKKLRLGLCNGRHTLPEVDGFVFTEIEDPMDFEGLYSKAWDAIPEVENLDLYVTGLTAATLAVVKVCERRGINLTCWHYNRATDEYVPQMIFGGFETCGCGCRHLAGTYCPNCGA